MERIKSKQKTPEQSRRNFIKLSLAVIAGLALTIGIHKYKNAINLYMAQSPEDRASYNAMKIDDVLGIRHELALGEIVDYREKIFNEVFTDYQVREEIWDSNSSGKYILFGELSRVKQSSNADFNDAIMPMIKIPAPPYEWLANGNAQSYLQFSHVDYNGDWGIINKERNIGGGILVMDENQIPSAHVYDESLMNNIVSQELQFARYGFAINTYDVDGALEEIRKTEESRVENPNPFENFVDVPLYDSCIFSMVDTTGQTHTFVMSSFRPLSSDQKKVLGNEHPLHKRFSLRNMVDLIMQFQVENGFINGTVLIPDSEQMGYMYANTYAGSSISAYEGDDITLNYNNRATGPQAFAQIYPPQESFFVAFK